MKTELSSNDLCPEPRHPVIAVEGISDAGTSNIKAHFCAAVLKLLIMRFDEPVSPGDNL